MLQLSLGNRTRFVAAVALHHLAQALLVPGAGRAPWLGISTRIPQGLEAGPVDSDTSPSESALSPTSANIAATRTTPGSLSQALRAHLTWCTSSHSGDTAEPPFFSPAGRGEAHPHGALAFKDFTPYRASTDIHRRKSSDAPLCQRSVRYAVVSGRLYSRSAPLIYLASYPQ